MSSHIYTVYKKVIIVITVSPEFKFFSKLKTSSSLEVTYYSI